MKLYDVEKALIGVEEALKKLKRETPEGKNMVSKENVLKKISETSRTIIKEMRTDGYTEKQIGKGLSKATGIRISVSAIKAIIDGKIDNMKIPEARQKRTSIELMRDIWKSVSDALSADSYLVMTPCENEEWIKIAEGNAEEISAALKTIIIENGAKKNIFFTGKSKKYSYEIKEIDKEETKKYRAKHRVCVQLWTSKTARACVTKTYGKNEEGFKPIPFPALKIWDGEKSVRCQTGSDYCQNVVDETADTPPVAQVVPQIETEIAPPVSTKPKRNAWGK